MYIVIDKKTKKVVHVNPAPLEQELADADVYFDFDPRRMEVARSALPQMPEQFEIRGGEIIETPSLEKMSVALLPHQKIVEGRVVDKTMAERVAEGLVVLAHHEKISGNAIVPKTLAEQVAEGLVMIDPDKKVVGDQIVEKSMVEKVKDGLVKLAPHEKFEGDAIVTKSVREQLKEGLLILADVKGMRIQQFSTLALQLRSAVLPDYKLQNAALGIYDEATVAGIKETVEAFRNEFYRLERLVNDAKDLNAIEAIKENFPKGPVAAKNLKRPTNESKDQSAAEAAKGNVPHSPVTDKKLESDKPDTSGKKKR